MDDEPRAGSLHLVAGDPALDFANTVTWRSTERELDHLQTPEHLLDWGAHAGLLAPAKLTEARAALSRDPARGRRLLREAVRLRDAIHEVGSAIAAGGRASDERLAVILRAAAEALPGARLTRAGADRYGLDFGDAAAGSDLPGRIAWSMLDLLRSDRLSGLKQCPAHGCGWLFLDTTRNRSRRWCDMATCGNRAKALQFRRRG